MRRRHIQLDFIIIYSITLVMLIVILAPVLVVIAGSFINARIFGTTSEQWAAQGQGVFTTQAFRFVWNEYGHNAVFSGKIAVGALFVCLIVGVGGGYVLARRPFPGSRIIEEIVLLPLSIPGIAMSIALIQLFNQLAQRHIIVQRAWIILAGHVLYTLPFMVRAVCDSLRSFDIGGLERAAQTLGAGFWHRFFLVVLPNLRHSIVVGSLLVLAVSWGEFNVSYLLNSGLTTTYPAALFATHTAYSFQKACAATTIFLAVIIPLLVVIQWFGGRELIKVEQGA